MYQFTDSSYLNYQHHYHNMVHPSICLFMSSVTLVHFDKVVVRNKLPFSRHTHVVLTNTVRGRGDLGVGIPVRSNAAFGQITLALLISITIIKMSLQATKPLKIYRERSLFTHVTHFTVLLSTVYSIG